MASSSSGGYVSRYDVFLSFRGEDTRDSFTDHLYQALRRAGLYTFRDNDSISRGEDLHPRIEEGIRDSRASIIVLSENYATSRWCLDELCLILDQRKERDHFVLPIFYHVDPSHIKKQEGTFQINVVPNTKWTDDNVKRWKAALEKVAQITGKVATSGPETIFLREVVDIIKERLDLKQVYCQGNLVGMETRDKEINSWLEQSDSDIFAIWGMPGSGKTTLARHIVYSNWHKFESVSILQDIGSRSTEQLRQLQEKLIIDIIEGKERTIPSVWHGTYTIEDALQRKKALIVLDNIVAERQLATFLGTGTKTQSKIIITTRERNSSKWFQSTSWRCQEHEMKLLDDRDSLELLSLYAFEPNAPIIGYEELIKRALVYCRGNPLALEVLGSSLNRGSQQFWESKLTSYEREVPGDLKSVLITSYNLLQQNIQKQLFLHIACFFIGEDKDYVEKILGPDYCAKSEIVNLTNSCLLSVSPNNKLMMHQLLQAVARTIVDDESHTHPGNRSRVWRDGESHNVLIKEKGSTNVKGLALDMEVLGKQRLALGKKQLSDVVNTKSFEKMDSLQLLKLNQLKLTGTYQNIFKELRWLCWREFLLEAIPPELDMENLVAIDMSRSKLKVFQPPDVLPLLQILNLTDSRNLVEVQDISRVPKLDTLVLENCRSLVHVCHTLRDLTSLTSLNLTGCENLFNRMQPQFIFPNSLKQLFLMDCNVNTHFPSPTYSFSIQPHLEYLNLAVNPCELLPSYTHLKNIRVLDLSSCTALKKLRCLPSTLRELYIFNCNSLETVTFESHKFTLQEFRYEGCVNLSEVEDFFKIVPVATLTESDLGHMNWLRTYQDLEVCLVGDNDITKGRTLCLQMLYEFNIMSISLPDIEKPNMIPENEYTSEDPLLSFDIPESHRNRKLRGLTLTFKYTLQGDEWVWFAKIRTNNGVNLIYNAKVFGKPAADESGIWLSYWPIGESLHVGDEVNVSIIVTKGLEINGCGASLVYAGEEDEDEDESFEDSNKSILENHEFFEDANDFFEDANDFFEDNNQHADILGGDISGFKLSKGTYYLCRRDYSQLMEVGRLTPNWFRDLVGDTIDYTEIGGWRKTGRRTQLYRSYAKLKTDRCIIYGPHLEELYKIEELSKSSLSDETEEYTSEFSTNATKMEIGQMPKSQTHELDNARSKVERDTTEIELSREDIEQHYGKTTEKAAEELGAMLAATGYVKEPEPSTSSSVQLSPQCRHFRLFDILLATENFDESLVIGRGGFGKVYKGTIFNGSANVLAAIKRLDRSSNQGAPEFWAEVEMLSKLRHCNLVSLFGYCNDEDEMVLVYEYMPNGTLEDHLHRLGTPPSWVQRLQICIGAGRGLHFLHTGTGIDVGVIHSDVKTSNILLQESWAAKISDFGLSHIGPTNQTMTHASTLVKVTFGYLDPDYFATGKLTRKSDVYSFGVVLLEVLCRKRAVFDINKQAFNLARWAQESIKEGNLKNIIDPDLKGQIYSKCLKEFVRITERCLHSSPKKRSTMAEVLYSLESILSLQEEFNNSVKPAGRTILDRMVNMLPFPFKKENTAMLAATGYVKEPEPSNPSPKPKKENNMNRHSNQAYYVLGDKTDNIRDIYTLGQRLGQGQFGTTYLCTEIATGVDYACKSISKRKLISKGDFEDVRREIQIMHHLAGHNNIVTIKGAYEDNLYVHIVMELCNGGELFDRIIQRGHYSERKAAELTKIIVGVVEACHSLGVMHRDLKPENFLLVNRDDDFSLKAIDFGLSVFFKPGQVFTDVVGSPYYVAPEVLLKRYGPEADVWTAGVILYILLSGVPPFWAETQQGIFDAVLKGDIDFDSDPWPLISDSAKDLIRKMLCSRPSDRLTAHEVLCHPWVCENGVAPDRALDPAVLSRLKQFSAMNKLKKMALRVIAESLSEEEIAGLREMFKAMDTDNSGAITFDELKAGLRKFGSTLKDTEIRDLMDAADVDNSGTIDYGEFVAATIHLNKLEREEHLVAAFQYFDKDGSGYITVDELQQACAEHNMTDFLVEDIIKEVDQDNDGRIDYGEFVAMMTKGNGGVGRRTMRNSLNISMRDAPGAHL